MIRHQAEQITPNINHQQPKIMQIHEISVVIDKQGRVQVHVLGIKGEQCLEVTKNLEKVLGGDVVSRELTAEASESEETTTPAQVQQRLR